MGTGSNRDNNGWRKVPPGTDTRSRVMEKGEASKDAKVKNVATGNGNPRQGMGGVEEVAAQQGERKLIRKTELKETEEQRQRILRSIMATRVRPHNVDQLRERLLSEWRGSGPIECRDLGPDKFIITFESLEEKERAAKNPFSCSLFDELRPIWENTICLSRRVWIEIMGMPIQMWSKEAFSKIGVLNGIAFETLLVTVGENKFDVHVREFGWDVFSLQVHLDCDVLRVVGSETSRETSVDEGNSERENVPKTSPELMMEKEVGTPKSGDGGRGNNEMRELMKIWDPLIDCEGQG
ncbi:hypothetical protein PIB30_070036 [Stylosanthes scabra]|uniref:DUF4283 domain-containing protein n=1 Tax=Stylosanthes scabra TaxID=79078 RepID=A0ABU6QQJ5_9FABA|nr:hypothetical protein [Stylosanthes scabra]